MIPSKVTNANQLVELLAERVKKLADESLIMLRLEHSGSETRGGANRETRGMSRGELIEAILLDDYCEEISPRRLEER